ncbi:kinetochore-associated Ndc80 complex subunit nuf2 [Polyrhizophydium stewartii]|uniref:Kinetochore-associated Ndc80 complex subunit nuf2 n=1 Tax=Polyrhizophydium stewartii TaxID=2732419 RepID=A0ABR4MY35_9FUNG|nr:kinetochore-associated Ndc80 complex subunit nuf2 [Polyrhizophydium stewartii]
MDHGIPGPGTFPNLSVAELRDCLAGLDIPVSGEDITKPTPAKMLEIYEALTSLLQDVSAEQFAQPTFDVLGVMEYPDIHKDSLGLVAFYRHLYSLVSQLGVSDFSLGDILNPRKDRVIYILSGFINFCKFREERMQIFQECSLDASKLTEEKYSLERKNAELAELINQIKFRRAQEQPEVDALRATNTALAADLRELKKAQVALGAKIDNLKKEKNTSTEKQTNNQFLLSNLKQDCVRLKSRVVHSPEKLKQVIAEMNRSLQEDKAFVLAAEKKTRELTYKIELMDTVEQDIFACQKAMAECIAEQKRAEEATQKLVADREVIAQKRAELRDQEIRDQQLQRQLKAANEKMARLEQHQAAKQQAGNARIAALKEEHERLSVERAAAQARADENERVTATMDDKTSQLRLTMDAELSSIMADFDRLALDLDVYQQELIAAMF